MSKISIHQSRNLVIALEFLFFNNMHDNLKTDLSMNKKFGYVVVYVIISDKFNIGYQGQGHKMALESFVQHILSCPIIPSALVHCREL